MAAPRPPRDVESLPTQGRVLIVEARFYDDIADELLSGATAALEKAEARYDVITVPGALEIPSGDRHRARRGRARPANPTTRSWRSAASSVARPDIMTSWRARARER